MVVVVVVVWLWCGCGAATNGIGAAVMRRFLTFIARHPVLRDDEIVVYFLSSDEGGDFKDKLKGKFKGIVDEFRTNPVRWSAWSPVGKAYGWPANAPSRGCKPVCADTPSRGAHIIGPVPVLRSPRSARPSSRRRMAHSWLTSSRPSTRW